MTNQQIAKNKTAPQVSDDLWRVSLGLRDDQPLPADLDRPARKGEVELPAPRRPLAFTKALGRACAKIDAGVLRLEDGLSLAARKVAGCALAGCLLAVAGGITCVRLLRDEPRAMDYLREEGIHCLQIVREV